MSDIETESVKSVTSDSKDAEIDDVSVGNINEDIDSEIDGNNTDDTDTDTDTDVDEDDEDIDINKDVGDDSSVKKSKTPKKEIKSDANELIQKFMEQNEELNDDEVEIDSDSSDDEYTKFDNDVRTNHILNYHNDLIQTNFDEIKALTKVVRDKDGNIIDPLHKTMPILTKFERARILGLRSKQLSSGADPFVKIPHNIIQSHAIAEIELEQNILPFIITRPLPNGKKEYWKLQDLEQIDY